jgi:hypothetical protein
LGSGPVLTYRTVRSALLAEIVNNGNAQTVVQAVALQRRQCG